MAPHAPKRTAVAPDRAAALTLCPGGASLEQKPPQVPAHHAEIAIGMQEAASRGPPMRLRRAVAHAPCGELWRQSKIPSLDDTALVQIA